MIKIATTQLWVHDQDEALAFYTQKLGFEVRSDVTLPEMGNFRWLTVGPPGQPEVDIVLMAIPGPPVMDAETGEQVKSLMAKGFAGDGLFDDRRLPGLLRGAVGARRRVLRKARGAPVRDRLRDPRPVGQQHPPDAGQRARHGLKVAVRRGPCTRCPRYAAGSPTDLENAVAALFAPIPISAGR